MKFIISRYNHDLRWLSEYTDDYVLYDRSEKPLEGSIVVPNIGSDIYDKFTYIIDNYDNLPEIAVYTKANLFKYISKEEFDFLIKKQEFTPLLTQNHKTYSDANGLVCYYENGMYYERNNAWYLTQHPARSTELFYLLDLKDKPYLGFAPGSNYILPKTNILKHSKAFYEKLRSYLEWTIYPGEAQIIERSLWYLWK